MDLVCKEKIEGKKMNKKIPCEIYSRVVGYYRPVAQWNKGKQEEWNEKIFYKIPVEKLRHEQINAHVF
jgi:anaerobic ribonucleoside-triphosphate reductase